MKKTAILRMLVSILLILSILGTTFSASLAESKPTYRVNIDIDMYENFFLACYGAYVYVDSMYVGQLVHGGRLITNIHLTEGLHTIRFQSKTTGETRFASFSFSVKGETSVKATIQAHVHYISIENEKVTYSSQAENQPTQSSAQKQAEVKPVQAKDVQQEVSANNAEQMDPLSEAVAKLVLIMMMPWLAPLMND